MKSFYFILFLIICCSSCELFAQATQDKVKQFVRSNQDSIINEYIRFLSIPDVSSDTANIPLNVEFIKNMMRQRGISNEELHGRTAGVNPAVYGEIKVPGAKRTIGLYAHYDGQPVNSKQWANGMEPFKPVFINNSLEHGGTIVAHNPGQPIDPEWRLTGRASADDKAGVMIVLNAYNALVRSGVKPKDNIKFIFEGEEEVGSTHLDEIFKNNKEKLQADIWIIIDGAKRVTGENQVVFGVRGDVNMNLTVYGAKRPLHSGGFGNWAPNSAMRLVQLLAGMKDEKGKVLIEGFYDDVIPLTTEEKKAIAAIPDVTLTLKKELGIAVPDGDGVSFLELLSLPTLNINGMQSAIAGKLSANIIPATAEATLDLRLVPGNDVERQVQKVKDYIRLKGYYIIDHDPTDEERSQYGYLIKITTDKGYNAQRTPMNLPIAQNVIKAVQATISYPVVLIPSSGGSLPLFLFEKYLDAKVVTVPLVNYDNNQHAENENVKVQYLFEGINTIAAIMLME
jgi:acetylornithine deacetylase/succinyl-diaminopimelate desuccinylase-like protein